MGSQFNGIDDWSISPIGYESKLMYSARGGSHLHL